MRTKIVLALPCALAIAACGGGGHSPTEPTSLATFATLLVCQGGTPTLRDAKLLVDGAVVAETASTTPGLDFILVGQGTLAAGHHTLSVLIAAQTASPSSYTALAPDISIFDAHGVRTNDIKLPDRSGNLATGQSIDYTFDS
jgi:hypothetical protein